MKGSTGIGKTTLIHTLPFYESSIFNDVIRVPENVDFKDVLSFIKSNVDEGQDKVQIISLDGREIIDDNNGLTNLMTGLNQFLRKCKDVLVCWPVNDENWYDKLISIGRKVGGRNFIPKQAEITVVGPKKSVWEEALYKLLNFLDKNLTELAVDRSFIKESMSKSETIGNFLEEVGDLVSDRISETRKVKNLPELIFVISSGKELKSEANRLRRAGNYYLKAEELH